MAIDFSLLKNIDFTNTDTLIFLSIVFIIALIISSAFVIVVSKIITAVKRIIFGAFGVDAKKPKFNQKTAEWLHKDNPMENIGVPVKNITDPVAIGAVNAGAKKSVNNLGYKKAEITPVNPKAANSATVEPLDFGTSIQELKKDKEAPKNSVSKSADSSVFGGKEEISRLELRQKLRYDPKIYKAQKEAGLYNLDRITRAKLEKELFPQVYGRNISKRDLNMTLRRMGREWSSATDPNKKAMLRKKIVFFKKIGGIK